MKSERIDYFTDHAHHYDTQTSGLIDDLDHYRQLALEADGLVVELGAGTGRLAIPIAAEGVSVVGIEPFRDMLRIARRKAEAAGVLDRLALVQGDMRQFELARPAALVTIPARAFLHVLTTEGQLAALRCCFEALRPGGRLALNVFNPTLSTITDWMRRGPDEWEPMGGNPWTAWRAAYEPTSQLTRAIYRHDVPGGQPEYAHFTMRWVYRYEMEHLLVRSGFEIESLSGDFVGGRFGEDSPEQVWIARRPG